MKKKENITQTNEEALEEMKKQNLKDELDSLIDENKSLSGAYTKIINEMEKRINSKININPKNQ